MQVHVPPLLVHVATVKVAKERAKTAAMMELSFIVIGSDDVIKCDDVWYVNVADCVQVWIM